MQRRLKRLLTRLTYFALVAAAVFSFAPDFLPGKSARQARRSFTLESRWSDAPCTVETAPPDALSAPASLSWSLPRVRMCADAGSGQHIAAPSPPLHRPFARGPPCPA